MKKKEVAERLDEITNALDRVSIATNAPITIGELDGIRLGLIAGMLEAMDMLGGEEPAKSPRAHASDLLSRCIDVYVEHFEEGDDE